MANELKQQNKQQPPTEATPPVAPPTPPTAPVAKQLTAEQIATWHAQADEVVPLLSATQRMSLATLLAGLRTPSQNVPPAVKSPYEDGKKYDFLVTHTGAAADDRPTKVTARDDIEAWAFYCEATKRSLSPRQRQVTCLGENKPEASAA